MTQGEMFGPSTEHIFVGEAASAAHAKHSARSQLRDFSGFAIVEWTAKGRRLRIPMRWADMQDVTEVAAKPSKTDRIIDALGDTVMDF